MPQPPQDVDPLFEDLWPDLPPETVERARACKAFTRARKVKTPAQLLRRVLLSCGLENTRREVAGHFSVLEERLTDSALALRRWPVGPGGGRCWRACCPRRPRCPRGEC